MVRQIAERRFEKQLRALRDVEVLRKAHRCADAPVAEPADRVHVAVELIRANRASGANELDSLQKLFSRVLILDRGRGMIPKVPRPVIDARLFFLSPELYNHVIRQAEE